MNPRKLQYDELVPHHWSQRHVRAAYLIRANARLWQSCKRGFRKLTIGSVVSSALAAAARRRNLCAFAARLRKPDGDRLLLTRHFLAGTPRAERSRLHFMNASAHFLFGLGSEFASRNFGTSLLDCSRFLTCHRCLAGCHVGLAQQDTCPACPSLPERRPLGIDVAIALSRCTTIR